MPSGLEPVGNPAIRDIRMEDQPRTKGFSGVGLKSRIRSNYEILGWTGHAFDVFGAIVRHRIIVL